MEYPTSFVNVAGNALAGFGTILSGGAWIVGLAPGEAISAATVERAGSAGLMGLLAGIATLVINGYIADRRDRRRLEERRIDNDSRFLELQLKTVKLIADARAEEQGKAAERLRVQAGEMINFIDLLGSSDHARGGSLQHDGQFYYRTPESVFKRANDLRARLEAARSDGHHPGGAPIPGADPTKTGLEPPK
jgi:hypothetical protein